MGWTYSRVGGWQVVSERFSLECMTKGRITELHTIRTLILGIAKVLSIEVVPIYIYNV